MDLRDKVARSIADRWGYSCDDDEGVIADDEPWMIAADAAIKAVLDALKEPTLRMISEGESAASVGIGKPADDEAIPRIWREMLTAFRRDHYLSVLAEEDGKTL